MCCAGRVVHFIAVVLSPWQILPRPPSPPPGMGEAPSRWPLVWCVMPLAPLTRSCLLIVNVQAHLESVARCFGHIIDASLITVIDLSRRGRPSGNPIHGAVTEVVSPRTIVPSLKRHSVGGCISPFVGYTHHLKCLCHAPLANTDCACA